MSDKYTRIKINALNRVVYLARNVILELTDMKENRDIINAIAIIDILKNTNLRATLAQKPDDSSTLPPFDEGILSINDVVTEEMVHKYVEDLNFVVQNPTDYRSGVIIENILNKMYECARRLLNFTLELFVEHIGGISSPINLVEAKARDPKIDCISERITAIYHTYQPLEVIFGRFYWTFEFKHKVMKRIYAQTQKLFWLIVCLEFAITSDSDDLEHGFDILYVKTKYYDPDKSINWNVGLGYFKLGQVLTLDEYMELGTNSEEEEEC